MKILTFPVNIIVHFQEQQLCRSNFASLPNGTLEENNFTVENHVILVFCTCIRTKTGKKIDHCFFYAK